MYNLSGKVVFVTGAGDGADVVVTDIIEKPYPDADWGGLPALQAEVEGIGRRLWGGPSRPDPVRRRPARRRVRPAPGGWRP